MFGLTTQQAYDKLKHSCEVLSERLETATKRCATLNTDRERLDRLLEIAREGWEHANVVNEQLEQRLTTAHDLLTQASGIIASMSPAHISIKRRHEIVAWKDAVEEVFRGEIEEVKEI